MGFLGTVLGIIGFGIGLPIGLIVGFYFFIYSKPNNVEEPEVKPLNELGDSTLEEIMPELPLWVKSPDYERVDWLNKFLLDMWPYLDKGICKNIRTTVEPIFEEYTQKYPIEAIEFENLSLGTLPPIIYGMKICETNQNQLVMEPAFRWAGNPNIVVCVTLFSLRIRVQLVDLQIFAAPRITLKPLVPTFPCFQSVVVSLMEKPHVDFGMKVLGADLMSIPGVYRYVQETIKKQVASMYLWPRILQVPILDPSSVAIKKPVGILNVKVVRAIKLLKMDLLGASDPYVKLSLSGDRLPPKRTTIKRKTLNPEWNENFKLIVKDPQSQILQLQVYDWDKVGSHDKLGMQLVPLTSLTPYEKKEFTLDLLKNTDVSDHHDKKSRGKLVVEMAFVPFKQDSGSFAGSSKSYGRVEGELDEVSSTDGESLGGAGLLSVMIHGAEDVEGERHNNPYALVIFRGERRKTKMIRKTRDPLWNEEFQFTLDEPPFHDKIRTEIFSKKTGFSFRSKESLGYVEINLNDVIHNGQINEKYHLINSKNGLVHLHLRWTTV